MKKLLLVLLCISQMCISQTKSKDSTSVDSLSLKVDSVKQYQYRLSFNNIKATSQSSEIKSQLNDIFHSEPSFCEAIGQYIFVSSKSVNINDVMKPFQDTDYKLTYFRKDPIITQ